MSETIAVYIHIPFCMEKCGYCGFYSIPYHPALAKQTIVTIGEQLKYYLEQLNYPSVSTVYLGGGTPSCLDPVLLIKMLKTVRDHIDLSNISEYTLEVNPRSLTPQLMESAAEYGVNRLSLGIQDINDEAMHFLGRSSGSKEAIQALTMLARSWRERFSIDLINGVPGQTVFSLQQTLDILLGFGVKHISMYSLILEPQTPLYHSVQNREKRLLDCLEAERLWFTATDILKKNNFIDYEISNFSQETSEDLSLLFKRPFSLCTLKNVSRHNLAYWYLQSYLGLGPAAVSTLTESRSIIRLENPHDIGLYNEGEKNNWGIKKTQISLKDFMYETLMMGFRLITGIEKHLFANRFGRSIMHYIGPLAFNWERLGLARESEHNYYLTQRGRNIMNTLLVEVLEMLDKTSV